MNKVLIVGVVLGIMGSIAYRNATQSNSSNSINTVSDVNDSQQQFAPKLDNQDNKEETDTNSNNDKQDTDENSNNNAEVTKEYTFTIWQMSGGKICMYNNTYCTRRSCNRASRRRNFWRNKVIQNK